MTIFNVIKYPVSYPPKLEEIEALPPSLFRRWRYKIQLGGFTPYEILFWHDAVTRDIPLAKIELLRKMISRMRS
jgi:hypothetical protein